MATDATGTPTTLGIPTYNTAVDAPSGNGFNAAMAAIDALIAARATLASPTFTGTPSAPTVATADNSNSLATTAWVKQQGFSTTGLTSVFGRTGAVTATTGDYAVGNITGAAPLASPTFTGDPKAPTPATGDNDTSIATTAFVTTAVAASPGSELAYDALGVNANITALTQGTAQAVIAGTSRSYDGTPVMVEFFCSHVFLPTNGIMNIALFDGATYVATLADPQNTGTAGGQQIPLIGKMRVTPSAATHQYGIKAWVSTTTGSPQIASLVCYVRVTKV